ncbi:lipoprotein [Polynucleobacter sp. SHI8]|uniref:BON domain-containing protein n=1 Tax=unclassified Polynucleobacter TaxID=2640945 RepID=UPI0024906912|nr:MULTISPECIES: BON domain-containing protein [unclassified Polynucleobacter]BDW10419.1 lipoprotein [Polynucleobacter sp. SHI2]BDW12865.1 lipoprotein [Polynucleobacter sp. SHI8]
MSLNKKFFTLFFSGLLILLSANATSADNESTGQYIDDVVITTKVKAAILAESTLNSFEITVKTFQGAVQLSGFVSSIAQTEKAVEIAKGTPGVTSVKNDMRVKGTNNPFYK